MNINDRQILAVDFDGTLCEANWPSIGAPKLDIIAKVIELQKQGWILILWTCRSGEKMQEAIEWSKSHGIVFDYHNENPPHIIDAFDAESRKIFAHWYLDDRSVHVDSFCE